MVHKKLFTIVCSTFALWGCESQPQAVTNPPRPALERALSLDRVLIAGQPTEAEMSELREMGISHVVNVRSPEEMNNREQVNFDETAALGEMGIDYTLLPIGGRKYPYRPEVLESFAKVMESSEGTVLLHCNSGRRARWLYAAYQVKYLDRSPDEVMRALVEYGFWPLPLEQLTGIPLQVEQAP